MMSITLSNPAGTVRPSSLLRAALLADGAACGALGLLLLGGGAGLAEAFGLPAAALEVIGVALLPAAAALTWLARRDTLPVWLVWAVIGIGAVWVADSLLLLVSGWVAPTPLGTAFVLAQAAVVAGLVAAEWIGLRQSRA